MAFFIPCTTAFENAVKDPTSPRYLKVLIDVDDDDVLEDVTSYLENNQVHGGGSGQGELGVSTKQFTVKLRNAHQDFADGDFAGAKCAIEAKVGTAEYIRIFTGYVSEEGCQRQKRTKTDDVVSIKMHDASKTRGMKAKPDSSIYINYKICDTGTPATSIFHQLAYLLGLADADLETATINHTKDYLPLDGKCTAWQELQDLNAQYIGHMCFRYDGKLRFISRHQTGWSEPTSEWTFDSDNIHEWGGKSSPITCNRVKTEFERYENLGQQVIYKNTDDWDSTNERNAIEIAAGAYWPGPNAQDKAQLNYKDPDSGEGFPIGIDIQMPTIGSVGSVSDIECEGGTLTLVSFNGSTGDTQQNPGSSEIILQNNTGSTITIRKFEIRGTPLRIQKKVTVEDLDATVTDDWDFVDETIPGKYAVSDTQAHVSTQRWVEFGKIKRKVFDYVTDWIPQIQDGAVATFNPDASINLSAVVESYNHDCKGAPAKWKTRISVREKEDFTPSGSAQVIEVNQGEAAPEMTKKFVTHTEYIEGFDHAPSGGTTTPTQVTIAECRAIGLNAVTFNWDRQNNLTNWDHDEAQVSDDQSDWYSLRNDGVDWKGTLGGVTVVYDQYITHENIPPGGTVDNPTAVTLYYRVRRVTKEPVNGTWSANASATTNILESGWIKKDAITTAKLIDEAVISAKIKGSTFFSNHFEDEDFDKWTEQTGSTVVQDSDAREGAKAGLFSSTNGSPSSGGDTDEAYITIPEAIALHFAGRRIRISFEAKQPASNPAAEAAVAYSTADTGNSGWMTFTPTASWQRFVFDYDVPEANNGGVDYLGIWGDTAGSGKGVLVDGLSIQLYVDDDSISETMITDSAITTPKLAALAVIADKIASGAVTTDKLDALAVTAAKLAAGSVETAKLAALAVTAAKIAGNTITADQIHANTLEALFAKIAYSLTVGFAGTGTPDDPDTGDVRVYIDGDEVAIQKWSGSAWINKMRLGSASGTTNTLFSGSGPASGEDLSIGANANPFLTCEADNGLIKHLRGLKLNRLHLTGNHTLSHGGSFIDAVASGGAFTITLPGQASIEIGRLVMIRKGGTDTNKITVTQSGGGGIIIRDGSVLTSLELIYPGQVLLLIGDQYNYHRYDNPSWYKVPDPSTGWFASKTSGWTRDSFSGGFTVDFSTVVPAGTKAVRVVIQNAADVGGIWARKYNDGNISNNPSSSNEKSHLVWYNATVGLDVAVLWLSWNYKVQFAVDDVDQQLHIAYPIEVFV